MIVGRDADAATVADALAEPGLTVIAGGPGIGRSTLAYAAAGRTGLVVHAGGGLVTLRHIPYLPLSRAIRAPLPPDDHPLAVEAVRARVGPGLLLLDDLQWADHATLELVPELARTMPVLATVRTPAPLTGTALQRLQEISRCWLTLGPLEDAASAALVRELAPMLTSVDEIVATAHGNPAVLATLAKSTGSMDETGVVHGDAAASIAALVAELPQDERTALAALGLLGRPAAGALLGTGAAGLIERGLAVASGQEVAPAEQIVAEVAAGVLPAAQRAAMHRRLAELVTDDGEAARHLAAAGEAAAAADRAAAAAEKAGSVDARADYLALAAGQQQTTARRQAAARAALAAGRTRAAAQLLAGEDPSQPDTALLQAEIALQQGDPVAARQLLTATDGAAAEILRVRVETILDPAAACQLAEAALRRTTNPELLTAYGEALLRTGRPDWDAPLREAMQDATTFTAGAALVAGLRERLRTGEAITVAAELTQRCANDAAYSWELNFTAELLWSQLARDGATEAVLTRGGQLTEHSMPAPAARLLGATLALARGDGGALAAARAGLRSAGTERLAGWVSSELAWLDGDLAEADVEATALLAAAPTDLAGTLATMTRWWATGEVIESAGLPEPAARALTAVQAGDFLAAASAWDGVSLRERVRALLATERAESLLLAEQLAADAGLAVLLGRVRRALRRHGVIRRPAKVERGALSPREHEVMALVATGQSSRRIADRLGLTTNTVETYVRSAMSKLDAKTRTEAAVRATELAAR